MRAIRLAEFGPPDRVLSLEELPDPLPAAGEVLVHFTHRPVNPSDLLTVAGIYPVRPQLPGSPGLEGVGRIVALGAGVSGPAIGTRVVSLAGVPGTWAERMAIPADRVLPVPDVVSDESAAQLLVNPLTAWVLLNEELSLASDEWLVVTAAASTLGRLLLQLARARSVRLIAVVRRRAQAEEMRALGASAVVCTDEESMTERIAAITEGRGASAAIDSVGGSLGARVVECLGVGGTMIVLGLLAADPVTPIDAPTLLFKSATVRGFWLSNWFMRRTPEQIGAAVGGVLHALATGAMSPTVDARYDLAEFAEAIGHTVQPGRHGKVLLTSPMPG